MKVLLVNGSPHKEGCTYTALCEVSRLLNEHGIDTDIFWIGTKALTGCIACRKCIDSNRCVFNDTVNEFLDIAGDYDGFVFGSPVHWGGASGAITSFMDRVFYADLNGGGDRFRLKTGSGCHIDQKGWNHCDMGPDEQIFRLDADAYSDIEILEYGAWNKS